MSRHKMMPPLPEMGESEHERFKRFAASILAVPRSKVMLEQVLAKLEAEKTEIEKKIEQVRQRMQKLR